MNHRNNRRSEATKNKIKQTLVDMLHTQDISKITVQALCEKAVINRSTFYNHYESPLAVLANIEYVFVSKLEAYMEGNICLDYNKENLTYMIGRILEFIQANHNICFLLKTPNLLPFFRRNIFREIFKASLMKHPVFEKYTGDTLPYAQSFILYGCGHAIDHWINEGCKESPHEIAEMLSDFITRL